MDNKKSTQEILQEIYPLIDIPLAFAELSPRATTGGKNYSCECPSCGKKRAYISMNKKTNSPQIACNRRDSCGYYENLWGYVQNKNSYTNQETLIALAEMANYDLEDSSSNEKAKVPTKTLQEKLEEYNSVKYIEFNEKKEYVNVKISKYLPKYKDMKISQKIKMVFTFIYQYSLETNQDGKFEFYASRGIKKDNLYLTKIGYLTQKDVKELTKVLMDLFPIEDLLEFGVIKTKIKDDVEVLNKYGKPIYRFKQYCHEAFCVIPNFDLYSNMITGLKFRNTKLADWQPKSMKEPEMSKRDICYPLPFAFSREMILDKNACIFLVEGHIDGLSLPVTLSKAGQSEINYEQSNTYFIASPGVNGMSEEVLGLLKGKFICLCFDQDDAGRKGAYGSIIITYGDERTTFVNDLAGKKASEALIKELDDNGIPFYKTVLKGMAEKLKNAGARVFVKHWDINLGGDVNELLLNGNLNKVFDF